MANSYIILVILIKRPSKIKVFYMDMDVAAVLRYFISFLKH